MVFGCKTLRSVRSSSLFRKRLLCARTSRAETVSAVSDLVGKELYEKDSPHRSLSGSGPRRGKGFRAADDEVGSSRTAEDDAQRSGLVCPCDPVGRRIDSGAGELERRQGQSLDRPAGQSPHILGQAAAGQVQGGNAAGVQRQQRRDVRRRGRQGGMGGGSSSARRGY